MSERGELLATALLGLAKATAQYAALLARPAQGEPAHRAALDKRLQLMQDAVRVIAGLLMPEEKT